ncbi:hypothetical protein GGI09_001400 [Coemansia sp. S100]|nr:hypothetical protein GGI09_001400 [Coemansia sp. S100]
MAPSALKPRTRAIAAKPATTYPASPPTASPDANSPTLHPASALGEPYIDQSRLLQGYSQPHMSNVLDVFHPMAASVSSPPQISSAAGTFMLAPTQPLGGAASPAWSVSSASLNGDIVIAAPPATFYSPTTGGMFDSAAQEWLVAGAGVSHEIMFPGLAHLPVSSALVNSSALATTAANDAAVLDGWLQQFVNAEAIEGVDRRAQSLDSGIIESLTDSQLEQRLGSPHSVDSVTGLLDSEVAAIAGTLSSDVLASMISSVSYCSTPANPSSELSMLAALPFATANIAPQKTLASSEPPSKKQRGSSPARKTPENGRGYSPTCNAGSSIVPNTASPTAPSANHSRPQPAGSSNASSSVSPSVRAKVAATRHMVPLAPRQVSPPSENTSGAKLESTASGAQSSSSGSNTPPGLSVLAKIAQKQAPIQVKIEDPQTLRPIAQACSPQSRLHCAPQSRSNDASEKADCSTLLMAAAMSSTGGETVAQKRQERLIKNRAAALLSRKRKRDYMTKLESEVEELRESNVSMARRLEEMEQRLNALAAERDELRRANASAAAPQASSTTSQSTSSENKSSEDSGKSASGDTSGNSAESSSQAAEKPDDAMEVDSQSTLSFLGTDGISAKISRLATIQPRAPKRQTEQQSNKQRATGALLMAVLFSFSLFTLPSLYTSDSQIATGGSQSAGMPVHALPAAEQRLLISDVIEQQRVLPDDEHSAVAGSPLLERVRRSISELAQQVDDAQAQPNNSSARVRPMTMEESAGLHAWIKHGLTGDTRADGHAIGAPQEEVTSSLSVVRNSPHVNRQLDYAMLYCPSMQHVLLGGGVADSVYKPSAPRVIPAPVVAEPRTLDDVDDSVPVVADERLASSRVEKHGSADLLVPTQAGESLLPRPRMSLYSPVVARGGLVDDDILAPWEEYAKVDPAVAGGRQKYLRIDVEVVGSRWVTADKFASGLY